MSGKIHADWRLDDARNWLFDVWRELASKEIYVVDVKTKAIAVASESDFKVDISNVKKTHGHVYVYNVNVDEQDIVWTIESQTVMDYFDFQKGGYKHLDILAFRC